MDVNFNGILIDVFVIGIFSHLICLFGTFGIVAMHDLGVHNDLAYAGARLPNFASKVNNCIRHGG
jgi:hypothetical protein